MKEMAKGRGKGGRRREGRGERGVGGGREGEE